MDGIDQGKGFIHLIEKYKYAFAVALIGVLIMVLPVSTKTEEPVSVQPEPPQQTLENMLEDILTQIQGAGKVKVLLTKRTGEETLYQTDTDEDSDQEKSSRRSQTVLVSDQDRRQTGLVRRTDPPEYLGALIVCQGADSPQIRLAVVEAVCCVTGLSANQIAVLKMK